MYKIYVHTAPNGKKYVGQTCQRPERRWRNGKGYERNKYFWRAIVKYGWDAFTHEIVCECETLEEANKKEAELIKELKTNQIAYGYNISGGADGREHLAESTKALLSEKGKGRFAGETNPNYGRKHTPEECQKMSAHLREYYKTHDHPRRGKSPTEIARQRMSQSRKKSKAVHDWIEKMNKAKAKRVLCVETGVIYDSAHEAGRQTGFGQGNISAACRGDYARAYGFHWEYV